MEPERQSPPDSDEDLPLYNEAGVDLTLVRWSLAQSPAERLERLEAFVRDLDELRALNAEH